MHKKYMIILGGLTKINKSVDFDGEMRYVYYIEKKIKSFHEGG